MLRWLWLSLGVLLLDQLTKQLAEMLLTAYQALEVLPFFDLTLMYNTGAAFSFLSDQRWFFVILALAVSAGLGAWLSRLRPDEKWVAIALSMIIGGALGNVSDRILYGRVIDFIDLYYRAAGCLPGFAQVGSECHWPAFNLADSAIFIGVAIMLLDAFVLSGRRRPALDKDA